MFLKALSNVFLNLLLLFAFTASHGNKFQTLNIYFIKKYLLFLKLSSYKFQETSPISLIVVHGEQ